MQNTITLNGINCNNAPKLWIVINYVIKTVIMVVKGKKENVMIVIYEKM